VPFRILIAVDTAKHNVTGARTARKGGRMAYSIYDKDKLSTPTCYGGLLETGQRRKILRGDKGRYCYRGFSRETSRLLCGQTFATRLQCAVGQEHDLFNLFESKPVDDGEYLPPPEELDD
jgi:hypothetical protein